MCGSLRTRSLRHVGGRLAAVELIWVAVKKLRSSYCNKETINPTICHNMVTQLKFLNSNPVIGGRLEGLGPLGFLGLGIEGLGLGCYLKYCT